MSKKTEKTLLIILLLFGLIALPITVWRQRNIKDVLLVFLLNSYANVFVAPFLVSKKFLQYPTRLFSKTYSSSIIYDYLLCSLVSMWFVSSTLNDKLPKFFFKVWLFALPQALIERWLEKNTSLIKYRKAWTWVHSLVTIGFAKLLIRGAISGINFLDGKKAGRTSTSS